MGFLDPTSWANATRGGVDVQEGAPQINYTAQAAKDQNGNDVTSLNLLNGQGLYEQGLGEYGQTRAAQNQFADLLQGIISGRGPSVAEQQLARATDANTRAAAGAIASQRGMSPALAQRLALSQGAAARQDAAGQGALLRAQEQQAARGEYGNLLGQMREGEMGLLNSGIGVNQAQNNLAFQNLWAKQGMDQSTAAANAGLISAAQGQNMGLAGYGAQASGAALGGALQGAGALGAQYLAGNGTGSGNAFNSGGLTQLSPTDAMSGAGYQSGITTAPGGGSIGFTSGPGGWDPGMSEGGLVLGRAPVPGDSPQNDTVPARLSPGEVVIPRSIVDDPVASEEFLRVIRSHKAGDDDATIDRPLRLGGKK